jgi:hypothetical protein
LHSFVFNSEIDPFTRRRWLPFSSTLVLPGLNIYESLNIDDPDKAKGKDYVFRARGRNLRGAIFDFAVLPKVDFQGAELEGARFEEAKLQGSSFEDPSLQGARLTAAELEGASFVHAVLVATLEGAHLQHAYLSYADMKDAWLAGTQLRGRRWTMLDYKARDSVAPTLKARHFVKRIYRARGWLTRSFAGLISPVQICWERRWMVRSFKARRLAPLSFKVHRCSRPSWTQLTFPVPFSGARIE